MKVHPFILSIIAAESFKSLSYGWGIFALKALWFGPPIYSVFHVTFIGLFALLELFQVSNGLNLEFLRHCTLDGTFTALGQTRYFLFKKSGLKQNKIKIALGLVHYDQILGYTDIQ